MTDQKHTKEPWKISDDPDYPEAVILAGETMVADANIFGAGSSKKINMANAKRIVECVNACAGIESPLDLRRQRDELREALILCFGELKLFMKDQQCEHEVGVCCCQTIEVMDKVDDVLTKTKGDV